VREIGAELMDRSLRGAIEGTVGYGTLGSGLDELGGPDSVAGDDLAQPQVHRVRIRMHQDPVHLGPVRVQVEVDCRDIGMGSLGDVACS
jgi:hypothetical protein